MQESKTCENAGQRKSCSFSFYLESLPCISVDVLCIFNQTDIHTILVLYVDLIHLKQTSWYIVSLFLKLKQTFT